MINIDEHFTAVNSGKYSITWANQGLFLTIPCFEIQFFKVNEFLRKHFKIIFIDRTHCIIDYKQ